MGQATHIPNYRAILHGPAVWKGTARGTDVSRQPPFIVAFEPQSDLLIVRQGTLELNELTIDEVTCGSQVLSIFFFDSREQAFEAHHALSKSLQGLHTIYDVFRNTRILEILEQALGSAHIPLEIVANGMNLDTERQEGVRTNGEFAAAPERIESYSIRMAVAQGLSIVAPEDDLVEKLREAVVKRGSNVNRISINFYKLSNTRVSSVAHTPVNVTTPIMLRRSGRSTPINVTRGTTPCARAGKAVVDLYSKRGLITTPTAWVSGPPYKNVLVAASPVLKAAVSSQELAEALEQSMENLRSVSHEQYIPTDEIEKHEYLGTCEGKQQDAKGIVISNRTDGTQNVGGGIFDFANAGPPSSERTNGSGITSAVDMALKLFDTWKFDDYEIVNLPEPTIQIPRSSGRKIGDEHINGLKEENRELNERDANNVQEILRLRAKIDEFEVKQSEELKSVKLQYETEMSKLKDALKEKEMIITDMTSSKSANESVRMAESVMMIKELNRQLDSVVMEKHELLKQVQTLLEEKGTILKELETVKLKLGEVKRMEDTISQIKIEQEGQMVVLRDCISRLQEEKGKMTNELNMYKRELCQLNVELDSSKNSEKHLRETIVELEGKVVQLGCIENELKMTNKTIDGFEEEIMIYVRKEEQLGKELKEAISVKNELRDQLEAVTVKSKQLQAELDVKLKTIVHLNDRIKHTEASNVDLVKRIEDAMVREERLRSDKSEVNDKYLKEKLKHEALVKEHDVKCSIVSNQLKELSIKFDVSRQKYEKLCSEYGVEKVRKCVNETVLSRRIDSGKQLREFLVNTILKSKAELARKQCQIKTVAKVLQLPENATYKQIVSELNKPKVLDPLTKQKISSYEKFKLSYNKLKVENDELGRLLEMKSNCYKRCLQRHDSLQEENKRLVTTLAQERERLVAMEAVARKQVRSELMKTNEEKRMLYAKQCELKIQNDGLKEEIGSLKQQLTMLQLDSIDIKGCERSGRITKCSTIDGNNLVSEKLNKMRTVFGSSEGKYCSLKLGSSDSAFEDDVNIGASRRSSLEKCGTIDRVVAPTSPCAYRDTRASLYSRRATLEKIRTRQAKNDAPFEGGLRQKQPWVF